MANLKKEITNILSQAKQGSKKNVTVRVEEQVANRFNSLREDYLIATGMKLPLNDIVEAMMIEVCEIVEAQTDEASKK